MKQNTKKWHAAIWPELKALLSKKWGVGLFYILGIKETNILFAFQKTEEKEVRRTWATQRLYRNGGIIWQISWK